jgi:RNA polymerase sigma-70 factor (ECF subfamily)
MDWSQLMAAAQDGDTQAYGALLAGAVPFLRAIARDRLPDRDAEEAVRQSLLTIHRLRHTYDPRRPIEPWLRAIAMAVVRNVSRARRGPSPAERLALRLLSFVIPAAGPRGRAGAPGSLTCSGHPRSRITAAPFPG